MVLETVLLGRLARNGIVGRIRTTIEGFRWSVTRLKQVIEQGYHIRDVVRSIVVAIERIETAWCGTVTE